MKKKILFGVIISCLVLVVVGILIFTNMNTVTVNHPQLTEGMTPVKWNGTEWIETAEDDKDWYNYAKKEWANVKLEDGSMFVWIPRYAYKITEGYHGEGLNYSEGNFSSKTTTEGGNIEIEFLKEATNTTFGGKTIETSSNSNEVFVVHPSFIFGEENLEGIWVAKYEASKYEDTERLTFVEGTKSIIEYNLDQAIYYSRNMENEEIYGWTPQNQTILDTGYIHNDKNNFDTHLVKNVEWGAVAYLGESKYGINSGIKGNTGTISGSAGITSTTTGNETGIYDMSGQNAEFVSAYYNYGKDNEWLNTYTLAVTLDDKYVDKYENYGTDNYGDAIYETSLKTGIINAWYEGQSQLQSGFPFFLRGKSDYTNSIYAFTTNDGEIASEGKNAQISFRTTIVISNDILNEEENKIIEQNLETEKIENTRKINLESLSSNMTKTINEFLEEMDKFTYSQEVGDVNFEALKKIYSDFSNEYQVIKANIAEYPELEKELQAILSEATAFSDELNKAAQQTTDNNAVKNLFISVTDKYSIAYSSTYKALYGKELD